MTETITEWRQCYDLLREPQDEITTWKTKHHPYMHNGVPWGSEIEIAHNKTKDKWIKITPASGSLYELITKEEADELMKDGFKVMSEKIGNQITYAENKYMKKSEYEEKIDMVNKFIAENPPGAMYNYEFSPVVVGPKISNPPFEQVWDWFTLNNIKIEKYREIYDRFEKDPILCQRFLNYVLLNYKAE